MKKVNILSLTTLCKLGMCAGGDCPTIYDLDKDNYVIQGFSIADSSDSIPEGENAVIVPKALIEELKDR